MLGRYVTGFGRGCELLAVRAAVGGGLCGGYVLLGATWLIMKTEGELQAKALAGRAGACCGSRSAWRW